VATRPCPSCGVLNPAGSKFCRTCGRAYTGPRSDWIVGQYPAFRFQVDPGSEPPQRDARWVVLVLGICAVIIAGLLLALDAILGWATSLGGSACGGANSTGCPTGFLQNLFFLPAIILLVAGAGAIGVVLVKLL
jgi:hypothetical protein